MSDRMQENNLLDKHFALAEKGRIFWLDFKKEISWNDNWSLILVPDENPILREALVRLLPEIERRKYMVQPVILSDCKIDKCSDNVIYKLISSDEMQALLKYYRLCQFASNVYVVSFKMPFGNENMVGMEGITIDDYLLDSIFTERG